MNSSESKTCNLQHLTKTMVVFIDGHKLLLSLQAGKKYATISKMGSGNKHSGAPAQSKGRPFHT